MQKMTKNGGKTKKIGVKKKNMLVLNQIGVKIFGILVVKL